jgi:ABC-type multidrug transport system fused ATPase/permease subunit
MNNHVEESFSNIRTVKAFSNEINEVQKFDEGNNAAYKIGVKRAIWQGLFGFIGQVTGTIAIVTVVW